MIGVTIGTDAFVAAAIIGAGSVSLLFGACRSGREPLSLPVMTQRSRYGCVGIAAALYALACVWILARQLTSEVGNIWLLTLITLACAACGIVVAWIYYNPAEAAYKPHRGQPLYIMTADKRCGNRTPHYLAGDGINYHFAVVPNRRK